MLVDDLADLLDRRRFHLTIDLSHIDQHVFLALLVVVRAFKRGDIAAHLQFAHSLGEGCVRRRDREGSADDWANHQQDHQHRHDDEDHEFGNFEVIRFAKSEKRSFGADGTFSLGATGAITFDATTAGEGVVIAQGTTPSDRGGRGFAHFFGMNDLMQSLVEPHFDTGFATTSAHGFGNTGITTIQLLGPNSESAVSFNLDFSTVGGTAVSDVLTSLNTGFSGFGTWALDTVGALKFTPTAGFVDYSLNITSDTTNRSATGVQFSQLFGIGNRYRADAAQDVQVLKLNPSKHIPAGVGGYRFYRGHDDPSPNIR